MVIWGIIALGTIYLIFRFAAITISDNFDQAVTKISKTIMSRLCIQVMESKSALVGFSTDGAGEKLFFMKGAFDSFSIHAYAKDELSEQPDLYQVQNAEQETEIEASVNRVLKVPDYYTENSLGLTREYFLSNGKFFHFDDSNNMIQYLPAGIAFDQMAQNELPIGYIDGDVYTKEDDIADEETAETMTTNSGIKFTLDKLKDINFLVNNFYIVDGSTQVTDDLFDSEVLLDKDMTMKQANDKPQILIYHTHSQEAYTDSKAGKKEDTVVGVGSYLTKILTEQYGYNVIHDTSCYDFEDRNVAYNYALEGITKILDENPSIEVVIDLHRDGTAKRSTTIHGEETAQIMLFNGLSRNLNGPIAALNNPNLQDNLAFSLQLQLKSLELYPGLFFKNYLKDYRFNLHVRPKSLLIELGTDENTLQSAMNAMKPFAEILNAVLQGK
jgi:stage II sporulation protein P